MRQATGGLQLLNDDRIAHLVNVEGLHDLQVVCLGLGSLGFPAMQHLAMSGVRRWVLIDRETLEPENLVKHPGLRSDLGREKTAVAADWLQDRNPGVEVERMDVDVTHGEGRKAFEQAVRAADLLIVTTDNRQSRLVASRTACAAGTQMVVGTVFRTGFGGDAYLYDAKTTGCYECFLAQSEHVTVARSVAEAKAAAEVEAPIQEARYGRIADAKYGLSGLASDISAVSALLSRLSMAALANGAISEDFITAMREGGPALSRSELHMTRVPYDLRGPEQPEEPDRRTVWLDTRDGQRYGSQPTCGNCGSRVDPEADRFCSWCGSRLNIDATEDEDVVDVITAWRPIPPPPHGHWYNHVSVVTRRHLIDDARVDENGAAVATGNVRLALQPFTMQTGSIMPREDCAWCKEEEVDA